MASKTVRLHGGPWHGRTVEIEADRACIHIVQAVPQADPSQFFDTPVKHPDTDPVQTREGMYTVVKYSPTDFEWDGWRSHD